MTGPKGSAPRPSDAPTTDRDGRLDVALDAAAACYLRIGVAKTTAADIAREAGISRATLYRRYGSHESIFLAVLTRESEAMAVDARAHLESLATTLTDPAERTLEGMMFAISQIRSRPVHAAVFGGDSAAWAAGQAIRLEALRRIGEAGVRPMVGPALADGSLSERDMEDLVDWILRILISYAAVPGDGGRGPAEIRRQLSAWFLPAFEARVAAVPTR
ncbi:MAG TPA: TetR/AcrR family transcriptional regulator [Acidimicrobiales bacterium]|jgi:AcrR family transcriptional regulator|nr:TetR/AcrR family transcriptional regulator [Acidimicrobiales bacterium]